LNPLRRLFACTLLLTALAGCTLFDKQEYPLPQDFPVHGIDVSKYQGQIDWRKAIEGSIAFAFIKATEGGDHKDSLFEQNWNAAREAGMPRGAYHFYYWCRPAHEQAAWFIATVPKDPDALPPVLDVEWNGHSKTCPKTVKRDIAIREMQIFLDMVEKHYGKRPIIYVTVDFYRDVMVGAFETYPLWVRSVAGYPTIRYGQRKWAFWQYTATGRAWGIEGPVDRNVFFGSKKQWQEWLKKNQHEGHGHHHHLPVS